jgi:hypothetical protein
MQRLKAFLKARWETLDLFPAYLRAVKTEAWDIAWGDGFLAIPFVLWWSIAPMPGPIIALYFVGAVTIAGYYIWRADHQPSSVTITVRDTLHTGQYSTGVISIQVSLNVRNSPSGKPNTFQDWEIRSRMKPDVSAKPVLGDLLVDPELHPLQPGITVNRFLQFQVEGVSLSEADNPDIGWYISYSDADRKIHTIDIPRDQYPVVG